MCLLDLCSMAIPKRWRRNHRLRQRQRSQVVPMTTRRWSAWCARWSSCNTVIPAGTCGCAAPPPCGRLARVKCSNCFDGKKSRSTMNTQFNQKLLRCVALFRNVALLVSAVCFAPTAFAAKADHGEPTALALPADPGSQHASAVRTGVLTTRDGLPRRLPTEFGPVNITQLEPGVAPVVRYTVRIETDARGTAAQPLLDAYSLKARATPSGVEITGALPSQAARSANAQFWVQFEITVPRSYNVEVNTDAGDITTGDIGGTASLHTLGGNIKTGRIGASGIRDAAWGRSAAKLETEGGHIQVLDVAGDLTAFTGGGHINVGNIAGDASLRTGGGHIRAGQIGGRAELDTAGGDIIVFLPRNLAANIDAVVANGDERHIEADPELHFIVQTSNNLTGPVHATVVLNGGGPPLKLRSTAGKIRLQYLDSEVALRDSLIREQIERISQRIPDFKPHYMDRKVDTNPVVGPGEIKTDWLESWLTSLEIKFRGGMTEDTDDFEKRLVNFPRPSYPAIAQRAGLQGFVKLQVRVKKDGSVEVQKLLEGEPALADAAIAAVKQWRAKPAWINGKPVEVISTVTFHFQLH